MKEDYAKKLAMYGEAIAQCPRFELKGKTMPYTSANGHMFSQLNKAGELGIRFSKEVQRKYMEQWGSGHYISYGAKMNGYVLVTEEMWQDLE